MPFVLASPSFVEGGPVPVRHTCDGDDESPELSWDGAPPETQSYALLMHDPDAPSGDFTHWLLWDIPTSERSLAANTGATSAGASGKTSRGDVNYHGPCPPPGPAHRYYFELYALDVTSLQLERGADRTQFESALESHVLGSARLMGRYARARR
jgi:Raf kinase inhibitor-like YbhB/YbcL family protein